MPVQFQRLIYPKTLPDKEAFAGFMVATYSSDENKSMTLPDGEVVTAITITGYGLPTTKGVSFKFKGKFEKTKYGYQFKANSYEQIMLHSREGIISFLSSQIKGIGPKMAERIYDRYGVKTLECLDSDAEGKTKYLIQVPGISKKKSRKILESYISNRAAKDIVALLAPHGISAKRAIAIYKKFGADSVRQVKENPYILCAMSGVGFKTADHIAQGLGLDPLSNERLSEAFIYTLKNNQSKGNICVPIKVFINETKELLQLNEAEKDAFDTKVNSIISLLVSKERIIGYHGFYYLSKSAICEKSLAQTIAHHSEAKLKNACQNIEDEIREEEKKLGVDLATEQRNAVICALSHSFAVITGGPGTGKSMITKVILDIYQKQFPNAEICLAAPTGIAAQRIVSSSGRPAGTLHSVLGLRAGEDGEFGEAIKLNADLVLVDEISMMDTFLAEKLMTALKKGSQVILIGDADQLPSIGPGAVLSELINSNVLPYVRLDKVFRQAGTSLIAINARQIRYGMTSLEYGDDFEYIYSPNIDESAKILVDSYCKEARRIGIENVALLTPYRKRTATGVNALNPIIRDKMNPPSPIKSEIKFNDTKSHTYSTRFREGDRIMSLKNHDDISNGETGFVERIWTDDDGEQQMVVRYDFGHRHQYDTTELDILDLGYACTVHKSQGMEYKTCFINVQSAHRIMLTRPMIYTAITRGKKKVVLVGERKAINIAISRTQTDERYTCLGERINSNIMKMEGV